MKPTFHHRPVNGPFEDPCLYIRLLREKRAILFDLGSIERLSPGDINKITDVFVTHTHIDHFIGFDHLLRNILGRPVPLRIYGPSNIIDCVRGKLSGYAWNLISGYPLKIEAFGISESEMRHVSFHAANAFAPVERGSKKKPFAGAVLKETYFRVDAAILTHDIDCLAFSIEEDYHINIDKAALTSLGLEVGPWLTDFKKKIRGNAPENGAIRVSGKEFTIGELKKKIAMITRGQKVSYAMDSSPTPENIEKIKSLARGADTLYSEGYFLHADFERARERNHLTADLAGSIASEAGARELVLMHCSPKYLHREDKLLEEARRAFSSGPVSISPGPVPRP
ncbi:MAG: MBL fold metallo-hydrolase [Nitrospiraceae bacterium]|nr:MBL fold metallo-hydrolase [Nitrospiraceae bacterium]